MIDYAISNLGFYIGTGISEMQLAMSKASSTDLLDCFGSINRLITTLNKISDPEEAVLKELDHYYTKRNCLYIELAKRLLDNELAKRLLIDGDASRAEEIQTDRDQRYREKWQGIYDRDEQDLH